MVNFKCGIAFTPINVITTKQFYKEINPTSVKILFTTNLLIVRRDTTNQKVCRGTEYDK